MQQTIHKWYQLKAANVLDHMQEQSGGLKNIMCVFMAYMLPLSQNAR